MKRAFWLAVVLLSFGCSGKPGIVGIWDLKEMKSAESGEAMPITADTSLEFKSDGTLISTAPIGTSQGTYVLDGKKLTITQKKSDALFASPDPSATKRTTKDEAEVEISGSSMTMRTGSGKSVVDLRFEHRP